MSTRAIANPAVIEATLEPGHEIGFHCDHLRHTSTSRAVIERDTHDGLTALARLGVSVRRWRVPWGACAPWTEDVARAHGPEVFGWSADTHDWRGDTASTMLLAIEDRLVDGAVVLMHDGIGPGARRRGPGETVRPLPPLSATVRGRGCEPTSLAAMTSHPSCR